MPTELRRLGERREKLLRELSDVQRKLQLEILKRREAGYTLREIAEEAYLRPSTVASWLRAGRAWRDHFSTRDQQP